MLRQALTLSNGFSFKSTRLAMKPGAIWPYSV